MGEINRENQWPVALLVFILFTLVLEGKTLLTEEVYFGSNVFKNPATRL